ncbi:MAG: hypothetical protein ABJF04_22175 [Reichenbachiella sp.]|uniref:DUF2157 domain-containing protein n=1 Tax=Reichenbachiella sp. TaxID=2184521 RepID=UPI00326669B6
MDDLHKDLFEKEHLTEEQFQILDAVYQRKVISLYYELRLVLYLGIMLFTGGIGYIVYQNLSDIGHIAIMFLLSLLIVVGGYYIFLKSKPYSHTEVTVEHIYFDYVLVLVSLLIISLFTYVQVYFDWVELLLKWTSLLSGGLFLLMAYRFDNKMVLSMGITALAAAVGLTLSPVDWATGSLAEGVNVFLLSICFGVTLLVVGQLLAQDNVKAHFKFTYHNFGLLLIYFGALALMFDSNFEILTASLLVTFSALIGWYAWRQKEFLFFLYSSISGYMAFTYLVFSADVGDELGLFYFPLSAIGGVILLVKNRSHFSDDK